MLAAFQARLAEFLKAHPTLPWITGGGWGYAAFPGQIAHRKHVDAVVSDRPAYLVARDGHMGIANSKAMQLAGITRETGMTPRELAAPMRARGARAAAEVGELTELYYAAEWSGSADPDAERRATELAAVIKDRLRTGPMPR